LTPSFAYEIEPGNGLINYSSAKVIALGAVNGSINEWKLEKDKCNQRKYFKNQKLIPPPKRY